MKKPTPKPDISRITARMIKHRRLQPQPIICTWHTEPEDPPTDTSTPPMSRCPSHIVNTTTVTNDSEQPDIHNGIIQIPPRDLSPTSPPHQEIPKEAPRTRRLNPQKKDTRGTKCGNTITNTTVHHITFYATNNAKWTHQQRKRWYPLTEKILGQSTRDPRRALPQKLFVITTHLGCVL